MSNSPLPISNLPNVQSTGLKPNDLLVVVNYDVPSGTTKNIRTDEFKIYINSGITNSFTGGTISGSTEFTNGLTANTLTVNGINITGDTYVTGGTYFTGGTIIFDYNTGGNFPVSGLTEDLNNTIAGLAEADEETIELNLTTNKIQLKETVASATGGTRTFQGDFAISGGTLNLDTIGSGLPIINLGLDSSGEVVTGTTGQTVTITGGTNIEIVGSYPDFGINYTGTTGGEYLPLSGGTVTGDTTFTSGLTANTLNIGGTNVVLTNLQQTPIVVSGNTTAENDKVYHVIANATFTDPTPVEGRGFVVFVRNGTATVGGVGYTSGIIFRVHSGSFSNVRFITSAQIQSDYVPQARTINGKALNTNITLTPSDIGALPISGGTVTGDTIFTNGLTATTISATTYQNLPVSGLTGGSNINISGSSGNFTISVTGITGGSSVNPYNNSGSGSTINWDVSGTSTNYEATLTATTTLNLTNVRNGDFGTIIIRQDGVGGRTLTLGTVNGPLGTHRVANGGGGSIILTSNASAIDILTFTYNGSIMFWTVGNDYT